MSLADRLPGDVDRNAAVRATLLAVIVVAGLLGGQAAVAAAFTAGSQPTYEVGQVPTGPNADVWQQAPSRTVELSEQQMAVPFGGGSVDEATVQTLSNDTHVSVRMAWEDPTFDANISEPRAYSDAAAVMLQSGAMPPITMGKAGEPVNIWYWRSSWQFGNESAGGDMYAYPHQENRSQPGQMAGNPLSNDGYEQFAHSYYAKGYGSLSHAPTQPVTATGERTDDGYEVVFVREKGTDGRYDATFEGKESMYLAFAVWNGSADEVNGKKSITLQFTRLDLDSGSLSAAKTGGSGDESGSGDGDGASSDTDGGAGSPSWFARSASNWALGLATAALATWLVAYWRMRR